MEGKKTEGKEMTTTGAQEIVKVVITKEDIKKYFCPLATDQELYMALGVIKSLNLNPFTREVHLVKYNNAEKLSIIVGYEVFLKRAERSGKLDGWKVELNEEKGTALVTIWRKDWKEPFEWEVNLSEFNKNQATWKQIPGFMGKKVAIAQGFRLAFPDELGGMPYTQEEYAAYTISEEKETIVEQKPDITPPASKSSGQNGSPATPAPSDDTAREYLKGMLNDLAKNDTEEFLALLKALTIFEGKKGPVFCDDINKLKGNWLHKTVSKAEKMWEEGGFNNASADVHTGEDATGAVPGR